MARAVGPHEVAAQLHHRPALVKAQAGVGRLGDLAAAAVRPDQPHRGGVEVDRAAVDHTLEVGRVVDADPGRDVAGLALVDRRRVCQRRAPLPGLDDARIARIGHRARPEVGADRQRVGVDPAGAALGLGQREAAFAGRDEAALDQVELAHHGRIGAAARQVDQAAAPDRAALGVTRRRADVRAVPDPVLALGRGQRVQVEHRLPRRLGLAVARQRRAPPQAARVLGVLPEVVEVVADAADIGNALARVHQRLQARAELGVVGTRAQLALGAGVVLAHPGQRGLAMHLFQPEVRGLALGAVDGAHAAPSAYGSAKPSAAITSRSRCSIASASSSLSSWS